MPLLIAVIALLGGCIQPPTPDDEVSHIRPPTAPPPCGGAVQAVIGLATFSSLEDAVAASVEGDVIEICPGEWEVGQVVHHQRHAITIRGAGTDPESTVLHGTEEGQLCFPILNGSLEISNLTLDEMALPIWADSRGYHPDVTLDGLRIIHSRRTYVDCPEPATNGTATFLTIGNATVRDVYLEDNPWQGISIQSHGDIIVEDSTFRNNGAGNALSNASLTRLNTTRVSRSEFLDSAGHGLSMGGGGRTGFDALIEDCTFARNGSSTNAGATALYGTGLGIGGNQNEPGLQYHTTIINSDFADNSGPFASHLEIGPVHPDDHMQVDIIDTRMLRGRATSDVGPTGDWYRPRHSLGRVLSYEAGPLWGLTTIHLEDLDLGTGEDRTPGPPFRRCTEDYEGLVSGDISSEPGQGCP